MIKRRLKITVGTHEIERYDNIVITAFIDMLEHSIRLGATDMKFNIECYDGSLESCSIDCFYLRDETDEEEKIREEEEKKAAEERPARLERMYQHELARLNRKYGK